MCPVEHCDYRGKIKQQVKRHLTHFHKYTLQYINTFTISKLG